MRRVPSTPLPTSKLLVDNPSASMLCAEPTYAPSTATGRRDPNIRRASQEAPVLATLRAPSSMNPIAPPPTVASMPSPEAGLSGFTAIGGGTAVTGTMIGAGGGGGGGAASAAGAGSGAGSGAAVGGTGVGSGAGGNGGGVAAASS